MKQSEYIPISVREKIEDRDIARIVDYLERNTNSFFLKNRSEKSYLFFVNEINLFLDAKTGFIFYTKPEESIELLSGPNTLLADNIVGIWGSLKNL